MTPKAYAALIASAVAAAPADPQLRQWQKTHGPLSKAELRIIRDRARGSSNHRRRAA